MDRGVFWVIVHSVTHNQTWLKQLSTHGHAYIMPHIQETLPPLPEYWTKMHLFKFIGSILTRHTCNRLQEGRNYHTPSRVWPESGSICNNLSPFFILHLNLLFFVLWKKKNSIKTWARWSLKILVRHHLYLLAFWKEILFLASITLLLIYWSVCTKS